MHLCIYVICLTTIYLSIDRSIYDPTTGLDSLIFLHHVPCLQESSTKAWAHLKPSHDQCTKEIEPMAPHHPVICVAATTGYHYMLYTWGLQNRILGYNDTILNATLVEDGRSVWKHCFKGCSTTSNPLVWSVAQVAHHHYHTCRPTMWHWTLVRKVTVKIQNQQLCTSNTLGRYSCASTHNKNF
jgi:hypothetical protein